MKGKDFSECFGCEHYKECKRSDSKCHYNENVTINDIIWRDKFHPEENLLDGFTYSDLILGLRCGKLQNRNLEGAKKLAKEILEQRLQDMWYLLELNFDQIMKEVER